MKKDRRNKRGIDIAMASGTGEAIKSLHEARRMPGKKRRAMLARMVEEYRSRAPVPKRGQQELELGGPGKGTR